MEQVTDYFEFYTNEYGNTEIACFGLAPQFIGKGFGGYLLLQARTGVDLRVDVVTTSEDQESLYLALNQAF